MKYALLVLLLVLLFALNLFVGSVSVAPSEVLTILTGGAASREVYEFIILQSRLPQALTALFCGASLATSGLLLQTAFRNPMAGPGVFGVSNGAGIGVALVMLAFGGAMSLGGVGLAGVVASLVAALVGALAVTALLLLFSSWVRSATMLLIVGIMVGYVAGAVVALLNVWASQEGVRAFMLWGLGSFSGVPLRLLPLYVGLNAVSLAMSFLLVKPLNTLLLGERYAANLGLPVVLVRRALLLLTGVLTALSTAFCGPISFIGLAVPHLSRMLFHTADHRHLLASTMLLGAVVALGCQLLSQLPLWSSVLPINVITPLLGAPVVIFVIMRRQGEQGL